MKLSAILDVLKSGSPLQNLARLDSLEVLKELLGHTPLLVALLYM